MTLNRSKKRQADPTGQNARRRKATRSITVRLSRAHASIKQLVAAIPSTRSTVRIIKNAERTSVYDYDISPAEMAILFAVIRETLNEELGTAGNTPPPRWFWADQIEPPFRQGAAEETNRINQLIAAAIISGAITDPFVRQVSFEQVIESQAYQRELRRIVVANFSTIKSLSESTASQVIQEINSGISGGFPPTEISRSIGERVGVSKSNAKRISDTEVNRAFNNSKLSSVKSIEQQSGVRTAVLHISALLPETRDSHARRHGKAFTVEAQTKWWDTGANRINCKCSVNSALLDSRGNIIQTEDEAILIRERKAIEKERFDFGSR